MSADLKEMSIGELLGLSRGVLAELRQRKVIRTTNAPAGDYAEWLVQRATSGELAPNSKSSWDLETHLHCWAEQVKVSRIDCRSGVNSTREGAR